VTFDTFVAANLDVVRFRATQGGDDVDFVEWRVGYATTLVEEAGLPPARVVIGTLHARGLNGWAEVDVGAYFVTSEPLRADSDFPALLDEAFATESLYDFARSHLRGMLSTINAYVSLPFQSPDAVYYALKPADDVAEVASGQPADAAQAATE
jgi:hypothetical protein